MPDNASHLVHYVEATFGGRPIRFQLHRDRASIEVLEHAVGSVSAAWGRFRTGDWTMRDLRTVLVLGYPTSDQAMDALHCLLPPREHESPGFEGVEEHVDAVIASRPLATYASLAGAVLTAAFTGLPAAMAVFDEEARLVGPAAPGSES